MPDPVTAVTSAVSVGGSLIKGSAANKAAQAQTDAAMAGVAEARAAREQMRADLLPYMQAGSPALQAQLAALGLAGTQAQQDYVSQQEQSPIFQALARQGEEAMLQKASATGGLRGGNIQAALAQFRPSLLNQFLEQQYGRLSGLSNLGQQSAALTGSQGIQSAQQVANLLGEAGAAKAGGAAAQGQMWGNILGTAGGIGTSWITEAKKTPGGII